MSSIPSTNNSDTNVEAVTVPSPNVDVAAITELADRLAWREELMLEKQQWRDPEDRIRAYENLRDAKVKWVEVATKTKGSIEEAKRDVDAEQRKAKLEILGTLAEAIQPSNLESMNNTRMRFEYISEVSDSIQGLLDTVVAGTAEKIKDAIELAKTTTAILKELGAAKLRGISPWVEAVKKNAGLGGVHHALMKEALEDVFKGKGIEKLTELEMSMVQSKILEMSGRTTMLTKLVSKLKDTRTVRIILVSLVLVVIDTIDSALNGGVTAAVLTGIKGVVGSAAGIVAGIVVEDLVVGALAGYGATTIAVFGCAAGAIAGVAAGMVAGMILDAFIELICAALTPNETLAWEKYLSEPIVYRVFIEN